MKQKKPNPDEIKKLYICLELPQGEIAAIIEKIKQQIPTPNNPQR